MKLIFHTYINIIILLQFLLCLASCSEAPDNKSSNDKYVFGNAQFVLRETEIAKLEQLATEGNTEAPRRLSLYYYLVENNAEKGFFWNEKAAANGNSRAQLEVGRDYLTAASPLKERDFVKSRYWLQKSDKNGEQEAKKYLSILLEKIDLGRLSSKALKGDNDAAYRLYNYYLYVEKGHKDIETYWLKIAATNEHHDAQYMYGLKLKITDQKQSKYWLIKSAEKGNVSAKEALKHF
jgi:TPR repeat protein